MTSKFESKTTELMQNSLVFTADRILEILDQEKGQGQAERARLGNIRLNLQDAAASLGRVRELMKEGEQF